MLDWHERRAYKNASSTPSHQGLVYRWKGRRSRRKRHWLVLVLRATHVPIVEARGAKSTGDTASLPSWNGSASVAPKTGSEKLPLAWENQRKEHLEAESVRKLEKKLRTRINTWVWAVRNWFHVAITLDNAIAVQLFLESPEAMCNIK